MGSHTQLRILLLWLPFATCAFATVQRPIYVWDVIPYGAAAAGLGGADVTDAHGQVFRSLDRMVPPERMATLRQGPPDPEYRSHIQADPLALAGELPRYRIKPLFILAMALVTSLGAPLALSPFVVNALAMLVLGLVAARWLEPRLGPAQGVALTGSLAFFALPIARLATPDLCASALLVASGYLLLRRGMTYAFFTTALLSILARPDGALFFALLALWWWMRGAGPARRRAGTLLAIALALPLLLTLLLGDWSWWLHRWELRMVGGEGSTLTTARALLGHIWQLQGSSLCAILFMGVLVLRATYDAGSTPGARALIGICLATLGLRLALLPQSDFRFMLGPMLLIALACAELLAPKRPPAQNLD